MVKYLLIASLLLAVCITMASCGEEEVEEPPPATHLIAPAHEFIDLMAARDFQAAFERFDPELQEKMPPKNLERDWGVITEKLGLFLRRVATVVGTEEGMDCVYVTCQFERGAAEIQILFTEEGKIKGVWFGPPPKLS